MTAGDALIIDAVRAGVLLYAEGSALRFKAMHPIPRDLAQRIKTHKTEVLAALASPVMQVAFEPAPNARPATAGGKGDPADALTPALRQTLDTITQVFADPPDFQGVTVLDVRTDDDWPKRQPATVQHPRQRITHALRHARRRNRQEARDLRHDYHERLTICAKDGGVTPARAQAIAADQVTPANANDKNELQPCIIRRTRLQCFHEHHRNTSQGLGRLRQEPSSGESGYGHPRIDAVPLPSRQAPARREHRQVVQVSRTGTDTQG